MIQCVQCVQTAIVVSTRSHHWADRHREREREGEGERERGDTAAGKPTKRSWPPGTMKLINPLQLASRKWFLP
ncbi:Hypothetical predicted protein [Scomber scombrus]|uniref:Uncharacterized protein n=1 Tax=Scomber scombrus TaxID=13677 RepID=A0AAV1PJ89_SCOSC